MTRDAPTWTRGGATALVAAALTLGASHAVARSRPAHPAPPCNGAALAAPFGGSLRLDAMGQFGCVGRYAYVWATAGEPVAEIGVTEVLVWDRAGERWRFASRQRACADHRLPPYVERWGCHSN